jgi:hypothetical protein
MCVCGDAFVLYKNNKQRHPVKNLQKNLLVPDRLPSAFITKESGLNSRVFESIVLLAPARFF